MIDIKELKQKAPHEQIFEDYLQNFSVDCIRGKGNKGKKISSPFCEDKNPSFHIFVHKTSGEIRYKCFSTGKTGDSIQLVREIEGIDFTEAAKKINARYKLGLNGSSHSNLKQAGIPSTYYDQYTPDAVAWMQDFSIKPEIAKKYGVKQIKQIAWKREDGRKLKFDFEQQGKVAFNVSGNNSGVKIYLPGIEGKQDKKVYRAPGSNSDHIFGLEQLSSKKKADIVLIAAGEKDVLCAVSNGIPAVCFQSESHKPDRDQIASIKRRASEIISCYDNDDAGRSGAEYLKKEFFIPACYVPEPYNDIAEYIPKGDSHAEKLKELAQDSLYKFRAGKGIPIIEKEGAYWKPAIHTDKENNKTKYKWDQLSRLTNWTISVEAFVSDGKDSQRVFRLENEKGMTPPISASTDVFTTLDAFRKELARQGNYFFRGNGKDLIALTELTFNLSIRGEALDYIGYNKRRDTWVFGNGVVKNGEFLEPDSLGMVDGLYLPWASEENQHNPRYGNFRRMRFKESDIDIAEWYSAMADCYGHDASVVMASFIFANFCHDHIFKVKSRFPILLVYGQSQSGKSTFVEEFALRLFTPDTPQPPFLKNITQSALSRIPAQRSDVPVILNELKNDLKPQILETLKGFYDGVSRETGTRDQSNTTKNAEIRTQAILIGEEKPVDSEATINRMVIIDLPPRKDSIESKRKFEKYRARLKRGLGKGFLQLLSVRPNIIERFDKVSQHLYEELTDYLMSKDIIAADRLRQNYATIMAPMIIALESGLPVLGVSDEPHVYVNFVKETMKNLIVSQAESEEKTDQANVFWEHFITLCDRSYLKKQLHYTISDVGDKTLLGVRPAAFDEFQTYFRKVNNREFVPTKTLKDYLSKRSYYLGDGNKGCTSKLLFYKNEEQYNARNYENSNVTLSQQKSLLFDFEKLPDFLKDALGD
jgi:YD repeat-containing protein